MRLKAEAARIEAEIWRQKATAEVRDFEQTAVLTAQDSNIYAQGNYNEDMMKAEDEKSRAEQASSLYADEIRKAREQEMQAEEARIRAEFAARKNAEEAKRQADVARRQSEEVKRLIQQNDNEPATTVINNRTLVSGNIPSLLRKSTGEVIYINKQVFCIGKADQGVDYKIIGNKSISRRHAYITSINGVNYLRDNNSTNHTYINGSQVYSNMDVVIPDNSIIRLSNEEFLFRNHS
jgi:ATPase subunit of ABC transporter with duplicated ATPase domains